jgi:NADPH:quinone reductase-like Zn-dependent oxidoreductase
MPQWYYYRDNNEVVECSVLYQDIGRYMLLRKSVGLMRSKFGRRAAANELFEVVAARKVRINVNRRFALEDAADAHKALEARATSGSTILTI